MQLKDTRAIVTGGVSGLGLAVARHLVDHGAKVALFDVNQDKGDEAVAALGGGNARFWATDVTDEAAVEANVAAAKDFLGGPSRAASQRPVSARASRSTPVWMPSPWSM